MKSRLVLMGPPGAGKGTQGERLAERLGVPHLATGDMLREVREAGTELGREADRYMSAGELVPDDVVLGIVRQALARPEAGEGFILDGFPRTVPQAHGLAEFLREDGRSLEAVVNLDVPREELVRRLSSRRVCTACGANTREGALEDGRCPACGGDVAHREDDRPETVLRRLEVYEEETRPVLEWYRRVSGVPVLDVDGTGSVDRVASRIAGRIAA